MLRLSDELGQDVWLADGQKLGRISDLTVTLTGPPRIHCVVVADGRDRSWLVPWAEVGSFEHTLVQLRTSQVDPGVPDHELPLEDDEVLLRRDVLDTQIVDLSGHRFVRVADVVLTREADDSLRAVAVEVGFGAVLRRLGWRRLGERLADEAVAWESLHLTSNRAHEIQLGSPAALVHRLDPAGLSELLARLPAPRATEVLRTVPVARAAAALAEADDEVGQRLLQALAEPHAAEVLNALPDEQAKTYRRRLREVHLPRRRYRRTRGWRRPTRSPAETR